MQLTLVANLAGLDRIAGFPHVKQRAVHMTCSNHSWTLACMWLAAFIPIPVVLFLGPCWPFLTIKFGRKQLHEVFQWKPHEKREVAEYLIQLRPGIIDDGWTPFSHVLPQLWLCDSAAAIWYLELESTEYLLLAQSFLAPIPSFEEPWRYQPSWRKHAWPFQDAYTIALFPSMNSNFEASCHFPPLCSEK